MGLEKLNAGFLLHVLYEQSERGNLVSGSIISSMDRWWANCLRNEEERLWIGGLIQKVRSSDDGYVFSRQDYEAALQRRATTDKLEPAAPQVVEHKENSTLEWREEFSKTFGSLEIYMWDKQ